MLRTGIQTQRLRGIVLRDDRRALSDDANAASIRRMSFLCRALPVLLCFSTVPFTALAADLPNAHPPANPKVRAILTDLGKVQNIGETSLSPDGLHLVWTEGGHGHGSPSRIMVSDSHGEGAQQVDPGKDCMASDPQWSPDSRALLFEGDYEFLDSNDPTQKDRLVFQLSYGF